MVLIKDIIDLLVEKKQLVDSKIEDYSKKIELLCDNSQNVGLNSLLFCKGKKFREEYLIKSIEKGLSLYITDNVELCKSLKF